MVGQIKEMIEKIVEQKCAGNNIIKSSIKVKIILKGVMVDNYTDGSEDNPEIIEKLKSIAKDMGVSV
jgi:hypothetical protein